MGGNVWPHVVVLGLIHRIGVGNGASEFRSNFQRMGVPGVLLRRICHASQKLIVEFCVLHDNEAISER